MNFQRLPIRTVLTMVSNFQQLPVCTSPNDGRDISMTADLRKS